MLIFEEGGKPENPKQEENQQQTQPAYDAGSGNRASALTTAPPQLPTIFKTILAILSYKYQRDNRWAFKRKTNNLHSLKQHVIFTCQKITDFTYGYIIRSLSCT